MEGSLSLNVGDNIALHLDHKVHGQHRPCMVFLSCNDGRIGIGINIISRPRHDDVGVTIENGRMVTVAVKPVHAFHKQFCIDGPAADEGPVQQLPIVDAALNVAKAAESLKTERLTTKEAASRLADGVLHLKTEEPADKVKRLKDQLNTEVNVAAENDRQLREQLAEQHTELDRLRFLEKQYHDVVSFFSRDTAAATDSDARAACQAKIKETEKLVWERTLIRLRTERQNLFKAVKQIEQKRKNEQISRIYYQELVQSIRAVMVEGCKQARGCKTDDLPDFVKAAVTLAHQKGLGQAIANLKGHHV